MTRAPTRLSSFAGRPIPPDARFAALPPEDGSLDELFGFLDDACENAGCSRHACFDVRLAMEELFVNVVRHGFPAARPRRDVLLAAWHEPDGARAWGSAAFPTTAVGAAGCDPSGAAGLDSLESPAGQQQAALHIVIADAGVPYDPLGYEPQLVTAELGEANKVGGLGIFLVCKRMDLVEYRFEHGRNALHLAKLV